MMTPINKILQVKTRIVQWKDFPATKQAFRDCRTLLKEAAFEPTTAKELVMGNPKFLVWVHASVEDIGGGLLPGKDAPEPIIWRLEWKNKLWYRLVTPIKPGEDLDINDLEMSGKLLVWLLSELIVGTKKICYKQVGLFSDNTAAVSLTQMVVENVFAAARRLIRVLALRQRVARASLLVSAYVAGELNVIGNIPS